MKNVKGPRLQEVADISCGVTVYPARSVCSDVMLERDMGGCPIHS